jgi:hypothetical protein
VATAQLRPLVGQLDEAEFGGIAICPFALTFDGVTFGLIGESDPDRGSWAELYPDRLGFSDSQHPAPPGAPALARTSSPLIRTVVATMSVAFFLGFNSGRSAKPY